MAAIEAKIALSDIAADTLYAQVSGRNDNARDSRDLANATTQPSGAARDGTRRDAPLDERRGARAVRLDRG